MCNEKKYLELEEHTRASIEDLTNKKFNMLTVVEFDKERYVNSINHNNRGAKHYWICKCDCGNMVSTDRYSLVSGKSKMCKDCSVIIGSKKLRCKAKYKYTFEQWCNDNDHQDYLALWDYDENDCNPSEITYSCNRKYYFKCDRGIHESKQINISKLTGGRKLFCNKCNSFGQYLLDTYGSNAIDIYWSNKNTVNPFDISRGTDTIKVWIKCENEIHEDYLVRPDAFSRIKGCINCTRERKESYLQEKVSKYIESLKYKVCHEYDCSIIPFNPKTNRKLPFDNDVTELKLIIEVMGMQHYELCSWHNTASKRNKTTPEFEFYKRKLYDRYKKYVAYKNGYHYLEIPCWTEDDESYKTLIDKKIKQIIN